MTNHRTPDDHGAGENERPRNDLPNGGRGGNSGGDGSGPTISLRSPRFLTGGWRLLPHFFLLEPDESLVIADWYLCPLKRNDGNGCRRICNPLQTIICVDRVPLFTPGKNALNDSETLEFILLVVGCNGLKPEIIRRWHLSEYGQLLHFVWGKKWTA